MDDLGHHLCRSDRRQYLSTQSAFTHPGDELRDHLHRHIRFEQRESNLAHRVVDVVLGEVSLTA